MTVAELRKELEKYREDLLIEVFDHEYGSNYPIQKIYQDEDGVVIVSD